MTRTIAPRIPRTNFFPIYAFSKSFRLCSTPLSPNSPAYRAPYLNGHQVSFVRSGEANEELRDYLKY